MNNSTTENPKSFSTKLWFYCAICLAVFLFGGMFAPGDWYDSLNRAPWNPPNIAFPIAWTILYAMIAVAGYFTANTHDAHLLYLWFAQLFFNAIWSWVFFGQQWIFIGLINLVILTLLVAYFMFRSLRQPKKLITWLMAPYFGWLCLATSLNLYIYFHN